MGFTVPFEFHFALDDAVRELAGIFVGDRVVVERAYHAERNVRAGDFTVADVRGGGLAAEPQPPARRTRASSGIRASLDMR